MDEEIRDRSIMENKSPKAELLGVPIELIQFVGGS